MRLFAVFIIGSMNVMPTQLRDNLFVWLQSIEGWERVQLYHIASIQNRTTASFKKDRSICGMQAGFSCETTVARLEPRAGRL